jgi:hypothetical protein
MFLTELIYAQVKAQLPAQIWQLGPSSTARLSYTANLKQQTAKDLYQQLLYHQVKFAFQKKQHLRQPLLCFQQSSSHL